MEELKARLLAFIEYFNNTMAKPFKWTYTGHLRGLSRERPSSGDAKQPCLV